MSMTVKSINTSQRQNSGHNIPLNDTHERRFKSTVGAYKNMSKTMFQHILLYNTTFFFCQLKESVPVGDQSLTRLKALPYQLCLSDSEAKFIFYIKILMHSDYHSANRERYNTSEILVTDLQPSVIS